MLYICSVYSRFAKGNTEKELALREKRYQYTAKRVGEIMNQGTLGVFSPIVHCHLPANLVGMPKDYNFYKDNDRHMITKSDAVVVLKMPLWDESEGITDEVKFAKSLNKPIIYLECPDYEEFKYEYTGNR